MGTRHLIIIYYKGAYVLGQYGQWDGYPEGQGWEILSFLRSPENPSKLKHSLDNGMVFSASQEQLKKYWAEMHCEARELEELLSMDHHDAQREAAQRYPTLTVDTSSKILTIIAEATKPLPTENELNFLTAAVSCEWAYVLDLDEEKLQVWSYGSNTLNNDRFETICDWGELRCRPGVVGEFAFDNPPSDAEFAETCRAQYDDDEYDSEELDDADEASESGDNNEADGTGTGKSPVEPFKLLTGHSMEQVLGL